MQAVSEAALSRGMVPVLWDTGSEIDRNNGAPSSEFQQVLTSIGVN